MYFSALHVHSLVNGSWFIVAASGLVDVVAADVAVAMVGAAATVAAAVGTVVAWVKQNSNALRLKRSYKSCIMATKCIKN